MEISLRRIEILLNYIEAITPKQSIVLKVPSKWIVDSNPIAIVHGKLQYVYLSSLILDQNPLFSFQNIFRCVYAKK